MDAGAGCEYTRAMRKDAFKNTQAVLPSPRRLVFFLLFLLCFGCDREERETVSVQDQAKVQETVRIAGCRGCHPVTLDSFHRVECVECHGGNAGAVTAEEAHTGLVGQPAHPDHMTEKCGRCHSQVETVRKSLHFTLHNEINAVRKAFGADDAIASLVDLPIHDNPETPLELAEDLLRRRCLRCHLFTNGDPYPETRRGTGCAACHLEYTSGSLVSHEFVRLPKDAECLHCHYGNVVGADYYGRFEHDFSDEYRTPYREDSSSFRPYGVEFHQLAPDLHQTKGLSCIDCHSGRELMGPAGRKRTTCGTCHEKGGDDPLPPESFFQKEGVPVMETRHERKKLEIPLLKHEAHNRYESEAACTVCHAQWAFNDKGVHLLRSDIMDFDPWTYLTVQGSFEVEWQVNEILFGEGDFEQPFMTDTISGITKKGVWFKGYEQRRWESPQICRDEKGVLQICRPILDLYLSFVDDEGNVLFDSVPVADSQKGLRPYSPHTIGHAGVFYPLRVQGPGVRGQGQGPGVRGQGTGEKR